MSKERQPSTPSVNPIANLAAALALFEPVFVNKNHTNPEKHPPAWTGEYNPIDPTKPYPNFHQLLNTCYAAMGAMKEFIKEVDYLRKAHGDLTADAMQAYTAMKGENLNPGSLIEGVETLIGQKHQCFDVMDKILSLTQSKNASNEQLLREAIQNTFVKFQHRKVEKAPIVNEKQSDGDGNILAFDPHLGIPESGQPTNGVDPARNQEPPSDSSTPTSGE